MDLDNIRVINMQAHLKARGIGHEQARGMNEHEVRAHMASAGLVNIPHHADLWHQTLTGMERIERETPADPWEGL